MVKQRVVRCAIKLGVLGLIGMGVIVADRHSSFAGVGASKHAHQMYYLCKELMHEKKLSIWSVQGKCEFANCLIDRGGGSGWPSATGTTDWLSKNPVQRCP